jgi:hypothetical protein
MLNKIKKLIQENRALNHEILLQSKELEWAHIYHDSIRGNQPIESLNLNIGRWAGNYCFFYVLNRILSDYKPSFILEFGLGESTKFISTYLEHYLIDSNHIVIEQSQEWNDFFTSSFQLSKRSQVIHCQLEKIKVKDFEVNCYSGFDKKITQKFDLYVVDGPFGSPRYSRYDIVTLVNNFEMNDEFIILFDDTNRSGEKDTLADILSVLNSKDIVNYTAHYQGNKRVTLIVSEAYKYSISF